MRNIIDLTNRTFGRLLVVGISHKTRDNRVYWYVRCACGSEHTILGGALREGRTRSCGCLHKEISVNRATTHGMTKTRTYRCWNDMKQRCYNSKARNYKYYGERGITVCKRWVDSFENFLADMGEMPKGLTLERVNNNDNYTPKNCKWATWKEQNNNKRARRKLCSETR